MSLTRLNADQRGPLLVSAVAVLVTLALLPFGARQLSSTVSFMPGVLAAVACFDIMSVWLLVGDYRDTGDRRILVMAMAYLWSLTLMSAYALAFPGVFPHPPLAIAPSVAPYTYVGWHVGFPVMHGLAWAPWPIGDTEPDAGRRRRTSTLAAAAIVAFGVALVALCLWEIHRLPVLIHGLDTTAMARVTAPVGLPLVMLSVLSCARGLRRRTGPERWAFVAVLVCLCDLTLTYFSHYRYSIGFYAGRTLTVAATAVVLVAMLASFRKIKATAEFNAAYDHLTGLPNRRSAYDALTALVARSSRMRTALAVVMIDLDRFKSINDTYGHAVGDMVLRAVGAAFRSSIRTSDLAARVGGEEFLVVLPDADSDAAHIVVERIRAALAATEIVDVPDLIITASYGIGVLERADGDTDALLLRADAAMYAAKHQGRDHVVLAAGCLEKAVPAA